MLNLTNTCEITREVNETMLIIFVSFLLQFGTPFEPISSAPVVSSGAIKVDGKLNETVWKEAQQLAPMSVLGGGVSPVQPVVLVCHDEVNLYVGAILPKQAKKPPKITVKERDGEVWQDDAFEVFVAPDRASKRYYQFIANAGGFRWDSLGKDGGWNGEWHVATNADANLDHWSIEFAIPFATVGAKPSGVWGFNVCWDRQTPAKSLMTWAQLQNSFHEPENFGILIFSPSAPIIRNIRQEIDYLARELRFSAEFKSNEPCEMRFDFGTIDNLKMVTKAFAGANEAKPFIVKIGLPNGSGKFLALIRAFVGKNELYRGVMTVDAKMPLQVTMRKYLLRTMKIDLEVDASLLANKYTLDRLEVVLVNSDGKVLAKSSRKFEDAKAKLQIDVSKLKAGNYQLKITVIGADGKQVYESQQGLVIPQKPQWLGNREGISDEVLPPWTPLKVRGKTISPWGRDYIWGILPFPEQVRAKGKELLASPIRLIVKANGRRQVWKGRGLKFTKKTPSRVEFAIISEGQDVDISASLWCEYDGCVRCDWKIVPKMKGIRVEEAIFEIPFKTEHAKLIYHYPGRWGSAFNASSVPKEGMKMAFRPYVWLGDEWRGLAWFCPSDENFRPKDLKSVTEVLRSDNSVLLRINLIQEPFELNEPISFTFGFEATPIRPNPEDVWDYRIIHTGNYGLEKQLWNPPREIRWEAQGNINVSQGTIEAWVRPHFDPNPPIKPDDPSRGIYNRNFFYFLASDGTEVGYYWNIDDRGMRIYIRTPDGKYPLVFGAKNDWKKGEWHHIAISWGSEIRLYGDGKLLAKHPYKGLLPEGVKGGEFWLGRGLCEMDVDEFCISDVQREPRGHLGELQPDEHTLLLEKFDDIRQDGGVVRTIPQKAAKAGIASSGIKLVDGKFGRAIRLFVPAEEKLTVLDMYRALGVRTICFHEHWSTIQNYYAPAQPEGLRSLVRACHERGIKLLVYYGYEMSNIAPEWELYSDEVLVYPRAGGYKRKPEQTAYICCYKSAWQDYLAWAIAKTMDEFDIDGVYLDGTANPFACGNLGHGCGYIGRDGKLHQTYPFFEVREMMKRIYTIVKKRKPYGLVNVHQSTCMTIPSVGWATSYWDGEQFGHIARTPETFPTDVLPLDAFRAEFMGHNWGVPAELLCYGRPYTYSEALAISLLHDVLVRPGDIELASKIWKAAETFGRKSAKWLPYWENDMYVKTNDENVKCSIYSRGKKGAMVVVSNLNRYAVNVEITLNIGALELPAEVEVTDVISGEIFTCHSGRLSFPLESLSFRMLWLKPAK